uniref:transmembrane gamma-carboxyglutamic acid protein 2-like n=1 Tax=Myxine glutinosa TaxID=7769 RepID=UPI00358F9E90
MNTLLGVLFTLLLVPCSEVHGASTQEDLSDVFITEREARNFVVKSHKKRSNFGEFELFARSNLERECIEEVCVYEEAHEFFEDDEATRKYLADLKDKKMGKRGSQLPMMIGITFFVACCLLFISIGLYYYCKQKRKYSSRNKTSREQVPMTRQDPRYPGTRPEDTSDAPGPLRGLPSYEDVMIASGGPHDLLPPDYPGSPTHQPGQPDDTTNEHPTQPHSL